MRLSITVCNVCQAVGKPTSTYSIGHGDRRVKIDLCPDHGAPLDDLLNGQASSLTTLRERPAKPTRRRSTPILTLEEIEQRKREARKADSG